MSLSPPIIDTHAHLFYPDYADNLDATLARANEVGVTKFICVGLDLETSEQAIRLAEAYPNIWATVGVHPHDAAKAPEGYLDRLEQLAGHARVIAIGEMGLDFYRDHSPRDVQEKVFSEQLALARSLNMPAIIHNRQADEAIFETVSGIGYFNAVVHCFSSDAAFARKMVDMGLYISFTGTVTFGKNHNAAALQEVGLERVMVETDCPYLAPVPVRGKTNEPSYLTHTVAKMAEICHVTAAEVAGITTANARAFFRLQNGEVQP